VEGVKTQSDWGVNWTDFPVMNMHPHAWPLYSTAKLLGLDFHEKGFRLTPRLPMAEYEFTSPLLGFKKTSGGYSGWYAPSVEGNWEIEVVLQEATRFGQVKINGQSQKLNQSAQAIHFSGNSKPGEPMRWEIS
jgi:hypothetical protein